MGQRSQIYIAYKDSGENKLIARYYQWNYGSRMISRARGLVEWLSEHIDYLAWESEKIARVADVNFDFRDIVISHDLIKEGHEYGFNPFTEVGNNDGKLFVLVKEKSIKYCFTDGDIAAPLTAEQYMEWDDCSRDTEENDGSNYTENCKFLNRFELMSEEELWEMINADYKE